MWSDNESQVDYLNRSEVVGAAVDLIKRKDLLPLSIGIYGDWGAGKSTLLKLIKAELDRTPESQGRFVVVEFDAWLYQGFDDTRAALMEVIGDALKESAAGNEGLARKALNLLRRIDTIRLLGKAARFAIDVTAGAPITGIAASIMDMARRAVVGDSSLTDVGDAATLAQEIGEKAKDYIRPAGATTPPREIAAFRSEFNQLLTDLDVTLVVIVDNLDRCLPDSTIEALEAMRLFLFMNKTAFIIAADQGMVQNAVKRHYGQDAATHAHFYLDKFIQVPLRLPYAGPADVRVLLYQLFADIAELSPSQQQAIRAALAKVSMEAGTPIRDRVSSIVGSLPPELLAQFDLADRLAPMLATAPGIQGNPRIIKRLLNAAHIRRAVAAARDLSVDDELIIKITLFERCVPDGFPKLLELISPDGLPQLLLIEQAATAKSADEFMACLPEAWRATPPGFLANWLALPPSFKEANPGPILYLCREVLALSGPVVLLTGKAREAFEVLSRMDRASSTVADDALRSLSSAEASSVMSELIALLRRVGDWRDRPRAINGAIRLAKSFQVEAALLADFLGSIQNPQKWLRPLIEREPWAANLLELMDSRESLKLTKRKS